LRRCNMNVTWGTGGAPYGWNSNTGICIRREISYSPLTNCPVSRCVQLQECPDGF
jgi:hypothetical protein